MFRRRYFWFLGFSALVHLGLGIFLLSFWWNGVKKPSGSGAKIAWVDLQGSGTAGNSNPSAQPSSQSNGTTLKKAEAAKKTLIPKKSEAFENPQKNLKNSHVETSSENENSAAGFSTSPGSGTSGDSTGGGSGTSGLGSGVGNGNGDGDGSEEKIRQKILEKIRRSLAVLQNRNYQGKVIFVLGLRSDGSIEKLALTKSSGDEELDRKTLELVRSAAAFPYYPRDLEYHFTCRRRE